MKNLKESWNKNKISVARPLPVVDITDISSAVLRRLIEEITNHQSFDGPRAFDRVHNRHNRS